jgi:hypothetical protein
MGWRRMLAAAIATGSTLVAAPAAMAVAPVVSVSQPGVIAPKSATLPGHVDPSGLQTTFHFEWDQFGSDFCDASPSAAASWSSPDGTVEAFDGPTDVTAAIDELTPETTYCFRIVAHNDSGTTTSSRRTFETPPLPPDTALFQKPNGLVTKRTVTMGFNSSIDPVDFECRIDGSPWVECTSPTEITGLADGRHSFAVRAVDPRTGLEDPSPATSDFTVSASTTGGGTTGGGSGGTPATPGGPGTTGPAPVAAAPKVGRAGRAKLKGAKLATGQKVSCAGAGEACRVTVNLTASAKGSKKLVKVGSAKLTVAAGATKAITVKLNAKGRKLLKKAHKLKVFSLVRVKRGKRIPVTSGLKFNVKK